MAFGVTQRFYGVGEGTVVTFPIFFCNRKKTTSANLLQKCKFTAKDQEMLQEIKKLWPNIHQIWPAQFELNNSLLFGGAGGHDTHNFGLYIAAKDGPRPFAAGK